MEMTEEYVRNVKDQLIELLKHMSLNKELIALEILSDFVKIGEHIEMHRKMSQVIENSNGESLRKPVTALLLTHAKAMVMVKRLLAIAIIYILSENCHNDAAKAVITLGGDPKELLQKMFQDKLKGV